MAFEEQPSEAVPIPTDPPTLLKWPPNVFFKGWKRPQKQWKEWVDRLAPRYSIVWTEIGIHGAIMSSTYELRNPDLVLALSQFWCPGTNSFVFPWGEATVTLSDVTVLTGLPLVGDSVTTQLNDDSVVKEIVEGLEKQRLKLNKSRSKKASHAEWIKNFMEEEDEQEHAGFLALWLSRFVFPSLPAETMQNNLFPIAAKLSIGKPVALGIPFLASIYRDLTAIYNDTMSRKESITVLAPFQLLQMWILEHFPEFSKGFRVGISPGEPRVARWHKLKLDYHIAHGENDITREVMTRVLIEGSESASAEKRKKVGESASNLDNGIDKGVPENMEVVVGKIKQGENGAIKQVKMGLPREAEVIRQDSESARAEKRKKVGESASKPSDLDNGNGVKVWDFRKAALELEEKIEYLEKLLSQLQDAQVCSVSENA